MLKYTLFIGDKCLNMTRFFYITLWILGTKLGTFFTVILLLNLRTWNWHTYKTFENNRFLLMRKMNFVTEYEIITENEVLEERFLIHILSPSLFDVGDCNSYH